MESKHFVTVSASAVESPSSESPGGTVKPCDMSCELIYWIVDDDEVNEDEEDWDKASERGDKFGDGAQWTEFLAAGVAAMASQRPSQRAPLSHKNPHTSRDRVTI